MKASSYDLIPHYHRCCTCGGNKDSVKFFLYSRAGATYARSRCNGCIALGRKTPKGMMGLLVKNDFVYNVKYDIKHKIDLYWKGIIL